MRIAQISFSFIEAFWPTSLPLFHGRNGFPVSWDSPSMNGIPFFLKKDAYDPKRSNTMPKSYFQDGRSVFKVGAPSTKTLTNR